MHQFKKSSRSCLFKSFLLQIPFSPVRTLSCCVAPKVSQDSPQVLSPDRAVSPCLSAVTFCRSTAGRCKSNVLRFCTWLYFAGKRPRLAPFSALPTDNGEGRPGHWGFENVMTLLFWPEKDSMETWTWWWNTTRSMYSILTFTWSYPILTLADVCGHPSVLSVRRNVRQKERQMTNVLNPKAQSKQQRQVFCLNRHMFDLK